MAMVTGDKLHVYCYAPFVKICERQYQRKRIQQITKSKL